jgi:DNA-binding CsgD family transcriptional regulator
MEVIKYDELRKSWMRIAREHNGDISPPFELEVHKKLLNTFHVGSFYYYILNIPLLQMEYVDENIINVLGINNPNELSAENIFKWMHPRDINRFAAHEARVTEFFRKLPPEKVTKYKVSYDYRLRRADGSYIWILMQTVTIQTNDEGAVIRVLGVHTDITHLKTDEVPSGLSFLGLDGEPSFLNVDVPGFIRFEEDKTFTPREKQILRMMVGGKTSDEIAKQLFISLHTVSTHRKNILSKSGCRNIPELLVAAVNKSWVE